METERRPAPPEAPVEAGPRLRFHRPGRIQALRLSIARGAEGPQGVTGETPSVEAVEARAAAALAGAAGMAGVAQRRRPVGSEEARPVLPPIDPRWVLAARASEMMRGEILRPAERTRLNRIGRSMGLTPFQCSLVIAIVQDGARRGEPLGNAVDTLAMVPSGEPGRRVGSRRRRAVWITALVLGAEAMLAAWWML